MKTRIKILSIPIAFTAITLLVSCTPSDTEKWEKIKKSETVSEFVDFARNYPDSPLAEVAKRRKAYLIIHGIELNGNEEAATEFLRDFNSILGEQAPSLITSLNYPETMEKDAPFIVCLLQSISGFLDMDYDEAKLGREAFKSNSQRDELLAFWIKAIQKVFSGQETDLLYAYYYDSIGNYDSAIEHFGKCQELIGDNPLLSNAFKATKAKLNRDTIFSSIQAHATGSVELPPGDYGRIALLEGNTSATGTISTSPSDLGISMKVVGICNLHRGPSDSSTVGWGIIGSEGVMIVEESEFALNNAQVVGVYAKQDFDHCYLDFEGRYIAVHVTPPQRVVLPVEIYSSDFAGVRHDLEGEIRGQLNLSGIAAGFPIGGYGRFGMSSFGRMTLVLNEKTSFRGRVTVIPGKQ